MDRSAIITKLQTHSPSPKEQPQSLDARKTALSLLLSDDPTTATTDDEAHLLQSLLSRAIRPLFSHQHHRNLTATGRKRLVPTSPTPGERFSDTLDWDDTRKPYRNGWTCELLAFILSAYASLSPPSNAQQVFETHFPLLVPPILNLIDDTDIAYKASGCSLLRELCEIVTRTRSPILARSGLADVFADALRGNFMHLPTLTAEEDSLTLLAQLYPAFRALVEARYPVAERTGGPASTLGEAGNGEESIGTLRPAATTAINPNASSKTPSTHTPASKPSPWPNTADKDARQALLDTILRHGILASWSHLGGSHVRIATLLLHEASLVVDMMGIYASKYLQILFPLLRAEVLCDPFGGACVPLLISGLECVDGLVEGCWPRVRERWWGEGVRGVVGCWVTVVDDEEGDERAAGGRGREMGRDREREREREKEKEREDLKGRLRRTRRLLERVVDPEAFRVARERLLEEDESLRGLFVDD